MSRIVFRQLFAGMALLGALSAFAESGTYVPGFGLRAEKEFGARNRVQGWVGTFTFAIKY